MLSFPRRPLFTRCMHVHRDPVIPSLFPLLAAPVRIPLEPGYLLPSQRPSSVAHAATANTRPHRPTHPHTLLNSDCTYFAVASRLMSAVFSPIILCLTVLFFVVSTFSLSHLLTTLDGTTRNKNLALEKAFWRVPLLHTPRFSLFATACTNCRLPRPLL